MLFHIRCGRRNSTAIVTLDVQGAFSAVLQKYLLRWMREHGWPMILCRWVESFLTACKIRFRHHNKLTRDKLVESSVPQSSPLSPPFFLLYITILVHGGNQNHNMGYTDENSDSHLWKYSIRSSSSDLRRDKKNLTT